MVCDVQLVYKKASGDIKTHYIPVCEPCLSTAYLLMQFYFTAANLAAVDVNLGSNIKLDNSLNMNMKWINHTQNRTAPKTISL